MAKTQSSKGGKFAKQTSSTKSSKKSSRSSAEDEDAFVPDDAVSGGDALYFKPQADDNKVRIISHPIVGWLEWVDKKPVRTQIDDEPEGEDEDNKPKKFFTVVIIDRDDNDRVKIWEITQQSIIKAIKALTGNDDWGKPFAYDIVINKTGEDLKTKYAVTPCPKKQLDKSIIREAQDKPCCLDKLYDGENPWEVNDKDDATEYFFK